MLDFDAYKISLLGDLYKINIVPVAAIIYVGV